LVEVPAATLIFRPTGTQVARVDPDGKIAFLDVTIARDNGNLVELSSAGKSGGTGVHPGDRLVLNISSQIAEGEAVTVQSAEAPAGRNLNAKR
jgi:hypothetical protein